MFLTFLSLNVFVVYVRKSCSYERFHSVVKPVPSDDMLWLKAQRHSEC